MQERWPSRRPLARDGQYSGYVRCPVNVRTPRQQQCYTPDGEAEIVVQWLSGYAGRCDLLVLLLASDDARPMTWHEFFVDPSWR